MGQASVAVGRRWGTASVGRRWGWAPGGEGRRWARHRRGKGMAAQGSERGQVARPSGSPRNGSDATHRRRPRRAGQFKYVKAAPGRVDCLSLANAWL